MISYSFWFDKKNTLADIESINSLLSQLSSDLKPTSLDHLNQVSKTSKILLAINQDNKIIGMATLAIINIPTGQSGRIEDVVVDSNFRGQGIGATLIKKLIREAKNLKLKKIDLTSKPERIEANKLYQKIGFSKYETNVYRIKIEQ